MIGLEGPLVYLEFSLPKTDTINNTKMMPGTRKYNQEQQTKKLISQLIYVSISKGKQNE